MKTTLGLVIITASFIFLGYMIKYISIKKSKFKEWDEVAATITSIGYKDGTDKHLVLIEYEHNGNVVKDANLNVYVSGMNVGGECKIYVNPEDSNSFLYGSTFAEWLIAIITFICLLSFGLCQIFGTVTYHL